MKRRYGIGLLGVLLLLLAGCGQQILGAAATERVDKTVPLGAGGTFSLENVNGTITVALGKPGEVHLVAEKSARAFEQAKAQEALSRTEVAVEAIPGAVKVETRYPKTQVVFPGMGSAVLVNYTVEVPPGTPVTLTNVNGAITVNTPGSSVSCETTNGHLEIVGCENLKAATVNGAIEFRAQNVDEVSSTNGHVEGTVLSLKPTGGRLETVNGHVDLTLPAKAAVRIEAENVHGSVESGFSGLNEEKHSLVGNLNGGGATLSVETVNGSIEVKPGV